MVAFALLLQLGSNMTMVTYHFFCQLLLAYYFVEICIACGLYSNAETQVAFIYRVGGTFTTGYLHLGTHPVSNSA